VTLANWLRVWTSPSSSCFQGRTGGVLQLVLDNRAR